MKIIRKAGDTSNILQIFVQDSSSTTGAGLTGLVYNSGSMTAYYHKDTDTTATAMTLVTMTVGTFTSLGFKGIDSTNMPGWYQLCPPDAALSISGTPKSVGIHLKGATNMAPLAIEIQLISADLQDAVRLGLTALPNVASGSAGAIPTTGTGTAQISVSSGQVILQTGTGTGQLDFTSGVVKANLAQILGTALTETSGQIAAAFKQFFNIATPTSTMNLLTAVTTATTATNLTNAPTAGDFTSTMKTSLNAATPAVTVSDKTGFSLSSGGVQAIWDALTSALTTSGSIGKSLVTGAQTGDGFARLGAPVEVSISADIAAAPTALLDKTDGVESSVTLRQSLRLILAVCCGKASGLATATAIYRDTNDTKSRITATVDANGNRSAVSLDAS